MAQWLAQATHNRLVAGSTAIRLTFRLDILAQIEPRLNGLLEHVWKIEIMSGPEISWMPPWYGIPPEEQATAFQSRLEVEITKAHTLWGQIALVVGRRRDQDEILVKLTDGRFAAIHLVWSDDPRSYSAEWPPAVIYKSLDDFVASMRADADEFTNDDTTTRST